MLSIAAVIAAEEAKKKRRREEVAFLFFEGYSAEEIAEYSVYSVRIIKNDIEYIENHREEYLSWDCGKEEADID